MERYELTQDDYENIGTLMNISYSLLDNFIKLRDLEQKGNKDTAEFKSTVACLKSTLTLEESIYERLKKDSNKLQSILNYFITSDKEYNLIDEINTSIFGKTEDLIKRRIIIRVTDEIINANKVNSNISGTNFFGFCIIDSNTLLEISRAVKNDVISTILNIFNTYLFNQKYSEYHLDLLLFKYNMAFLYKNVENDFIEHDFSINPELFWTAKMLTDYRNLDEELIKKYHHSYASEIINDNLEKVLNPTYDLDTDVKAIINEILIRVAALFSNETSLNELKKSLNETINFNKMLMPNANSKEIYFLLKILDMNKKDKELPRIVSLRLTK